MNARRLRPILRRRNLAPLTILLLFSLVAVCGFSYSRAQSDEKEEREVVEKIPKHLAIKVKIKKPERLKDVENEDWLGELEVEVTNTGTKPIYYIPVPLPGEDQGRARGAARALGVGRDPRRGAVGARQVVKGGGARRHSSAPGASALSVFVRRV